MNKAKEYLTSIGLENVIGEEFFNDDDKSWYKVEELMESYHQSKLSNIGRSKVDSAVTTVNGDYTNVSHRTAHGDREKTAVESALASTPETKEVCVECRKNALIEMMKEDEKSGLYDK